MKAEMSSNPFDIISHSEILLPSEFSLLENMQEELKDNFIKVLLSNG